MGAVGAAKASGATISMPRFVPMKCLFRRIRMRVVVAVLCLSPFAPALGQVAPSPPTEPQVISRGIGEATAEPTKAIVTIGVDVRGDSVLALSAANAARIDRIRAALVARRIAPQQITTRGYSVTVNERALIPRAGPFMGDTSRYIVRNTMRVEVRPVDAIGTVIDAALAAGANQAYAAEYDVDDRGALQQSAIEQAVRNARREAETMARAAGGRLGELRELTNLSSPLISPVAFRAAGGDFDFAPPPPPTVISPRSVVVRAQVMGRWRLMMPPL